MVLGIAQYRQEQYNDSKQSLWKAIELMEDDAHPRTSCFLAMTCWQLGEKVAARTHLEEADGWIKKNQIVDQVLLGFRNEAADLLGENENKSDRD